MWSSAPTGGWENGPPRRVGSCPAEGGDDPTGRPQGDNRATPDFRNPVGFALRQIVRQGGPGRCGHRPLRRVQDRGRPVAAPTAGKPPDFVIARAGTARGNPFPIHQCAIHGGFPRIAAGLDLPCGKLSACGGPGRCGHRPLRAGVGLRTASGRPYGGNLPFCHCEGRNGPWQSAAPVPYGCDNPRRPGVWPPYARTPPRRKDAAPTGMGAPYESERNKVKQ